MKITLLLILLMGIPAMALAQITQNATRLLRIYEDDDFFNIWGKGTDRAYSNGTLIGYRYMKNKPSRFLDKWIMPKAGKQAINVWEWNLMQIMITPNIISDSTFIPDDFYYAGALFARHELTSYNPEKRYSLHSELLFGVMGPWAFAEETQTFFHNLIHYQKPNGWQHQVPNAPLLNYNFTYEKMLYAPKPFLEIVGSASAQAGTMVASMQAKTNIRVGKFNSWFGNRDLKIATRNKFQAYAFGNPMFNIVYYNALLQGGIFKWRNEDFIDQSGQQVTHMKHFTVGIDYGVGFGFNRCSVIYTQQTRSAWMSGTGKHSVGNISLLISLSKAPVPPPVQ
ncbi:lipid A deacylase LpxR family protein [Chitinophaga sp. sic0106]|uniref:lipid A deacylase LpxR family protein n=1 Tax=Chitinophaga sp. sic0106 TaxID=2854785 RepID=UPI001C4765E5|nr:lipid A deacylase LpxR family protein [Chitinophaga sp. sic0106]MBV7528841.1 lipid A deacylase LpxR family protein [Chitinophaga sp. sic0106]